MRATLIGTEYLSSRVKQLHFIPQAGTGFQFEPGQFVTLGLQTEQGLVERSYSIASAPGNTEKFELCISLNPEGTATPLLWNLENGAEVEYSGPHGSFVLRNGVELEHVFICTGTGIAPFRSMIAKLLESGFSEQVYLIFGNRLQEDILYRAEFSELEEKHSNFHFIPVLSREEWNGERGYVHQVYETLFADGRDARFYVCGWQVMCSEARERLKKLGYNRRQYFFEDYG